MKILLLYTTDHKAQDSDSTISFSKSQEETIEKEAPSSFLKEGFLKVESVVVAHPEDETSKFDGLDEDFKTAIDWTNVPG